MTQVSSPRSHLGVVMSLAALTLAVVSADNNWPQFRGAQAGVAADDPSLPDAWGPSQNIVWKIDVPGRSWSSPVVWGDHVFVTTAIDTAETDTLLPVSAYVSRSNGGTMSFADLAKTLGAAPLAAVRHRFQDRQDSLGAPGGQRRCRRSRGT